MFKYSVILTNVGSCCDRFLPSGYDRPYTTEELFERLSRVPDVAGTELIGGASITKETVELVRVQLKKYGFVPTSIIPDLFGKAKWGKGAFTSPDKDTRKSAVEATLEMIDIAAQIKCEVVNIWNGQDGHDYPMQMDYDLEMKRLVEGIRECAVYAKEKGVKISLEYKMKEPRTHSILSNVYSTLLIADKTGCENVGVTIDTGHSLQAYENLAESACALMREGKLFHMHFNDNYRHWDDDMIVGSIHTIEYIELLYWLKRNGYGGWLSMDQYPYREDAVEAVKQSMEWLKTFDRLTDKIDMDKLAHILLKQDAAASTGYLRQLMFN